MVSSHGVGLKGGKSLIVNDKSQENEMIEDENFVYKQGKANVKKEDEEYLWGIICIEVRIICIEERVVNNMFYIWTIVLIWYKLAWISLNEVGNMSCL